LMVETHKLLRGHATTNADFFSMTMQFCLHHLSAAPFLFMIYYSPPRRQQTCGKFTAPPLEKRAQNAYTLYCASTSLHFPKKAGVIWNSYSGERAALYWRLY